MENKPAVMLENHIEITERSVIVSASSSCFVSCPGCYNYFKSPLVDTDTIISFLNILTNRFNLKKVTIGGGDPLARKDIIDLLKGIKSLNLFISLDTVGIPIIKQAQINFMGKGIVPKISVNELAKYVDIIGIPVDGSSDQIIQFFRHGGYIKDQISILNELSSAKISICVNTVVHKSNISDLKNIFDSFATIENIVEWQLFQFMPIGHLGFNNKLDFEISDKDFHAAIADLLPYVVNKSTNIRFNPKSRSTRKNRYLLIDGQGDVWIPKHSVKSVWIDSDTSNERIIIGKIADDKLIDNLYPYFSSFIDKQ